MIFSLNNYRTLNMSNWIVWMSCKLCLHIPVSLTFPMYIYIPIRVPHVYIYMPFWHGDWSRSRGAVSTWSQRWRPIDLLHACRLHHHFGGLCLVVVRKWGKVPIQFSYSTFLTQNVHSLVANYQQESKRVFWLKLKAHKLLKNVLSSYIRHQSIKFNCLLLAIPNFM